jgi:taurine dehydrogenase small subunit
MMTNNATITIGYLDAIQDAFNRHDIEGILGYFADDCIWLMARGPTSPQGRLCRGKQEIGQVLSARYEVIKDMRWVNMRHWICGNTKALSEWNVQGTLPDGSTFDYLGCDLWEFRDGLVTKKDTYWKYIEAA